MRISHITMLMTLASLSACAATHTLNQPAQIGVNLPASTLIQQWGQPTRVYTGANHNTYYVYTTERVLTSRMVSPPTLAVTGIKQGTPTVAMVSTNNTPRTSLQQCTVVFEVNAQQQVVNKSQAECIGN